MWEAYGLRRWIKEHFVAMDDDREEDQHVMNDALEEHRPGMRKEERRG